MKAGRRVSDVACHLGASTGGVRNWVRQDRIDRGEIQGVSKVKIAQLRAARKRIRELKEEVTILRTAAALLGEHRPHPRGFAR